MSIVIGTDGTNSPTPINLYEQQFITVVSKTGNYFYIIISRDWDGENAVHFLNPMDEADLLTLMEVEEKPPTLSAPTT